MNSPRQSFDTGPAHTKAARGRPAVVLLSGGLDSAANLAICSEQDRPVLALTVNYGQRAAAREIRAARTLAAYYEVKHEILDLTWLGIMGGSALTDTASKVPELAVEELDHLPTIECSAKAVWVPNRNGVLINCAAAYAERIGAELVVVGFNIEEATTFPDNTAGFLRATSAALAFSTSTKVAAHCYTVELNKKQIVQTLRALARPFPFDQVWSCYFGAENACGRCESCRRFARAMSLGASE